MHEHEEKPSFSKGRRWTMRLSLVLAMMAALALVIMVNYLGSGYFTRFQWTSHARIELSPQTIRILESLTNDVHVTIFFDPRDQVELHSLVTGLLTEYRNVNPRHVKLRMLDYTRFDGEARMVLARHNLTALESRDFVIFEYEGRTKTVFSQGMVDYDLSGLLRGETEIRRTAFRGEMLFTAAIFGVTHPRPIKAYFLGGHGEHDPASDRNDGYSKLASILKDENNIEWERITLQGTNNIPADCQLLIIAGPSRARFLDSELERIDQYLRRGGRLFVLLNNVRSSNSGIERLLERWGVGVADSIIFDKNHSPTGQDIIPSFINGDHPVLKPLAAESLPIYLMAPRTIGRSPNTPQGPNAPELTFLAATSQDATDGQQQGSFPLMVAVEQGGIKGVNAERGATRLLVVGDSDCLTDQVIDRAANRLFASFAVNWLVNRPQILLEGIGPRPITEYKLLMTPGQMRTVQWALLAGMPGGVLLFGSLVWLRRRS
jgi:hypothetical protein